MSYEADNFVVGVNGIQNGVKYRVHLIEFGHGSMIFMRSYSIDNAIVKWHFRLLD